MAISSIPMRKWQEEAFSKWVTAGYRGIASVVTGGGKTLFALKCLQHYRSNVPLATALIVVPTQALMDQWTEEVISFFDISLKEIKFITTKSRIAANSINIGIINSVSKLASNNQFTVPVFLIVDECHRAATPTFESIFRIPRNATLGLSATPERPYDEGFEQILKPNLGDVLIRYTYREALRDNVIVPFEVNNIVFDFEPEVQKEYDRLSQAIKIESEKSGFDSDRTITLMLKRARVSNLSLRRIEETLKIVARVKGKKVLIFHEDIQACQMINDILVDNKISSRLYHSKLPQSVRVKALHDYRSGAARVLVTCRALDEGFNVPSTEIGIIAASTGSRRQRIQRLGRILRPSENKSSASVYTLISAAPEIGRLADEADELEGVARVNWIRK